MTKTDGVPLFVEESTKMVLESGLLRERDDHYELTGPLPPLAIPATLHDSLMARLQEMAPPGAIWVGEGSYRLARDAFQWQAVGPLAVKRKAEPVTAYALLGRRVVKSRFEVQAQRGLTRFVGGTRTSSSC